MCVCVQNSVGIVSRWIISVVCVEQCWHCQQMDHICSVCRTVLALSADVVCAEQCWHCQQVDHI